MEKPTRDKLFNNPDDFRANFIKKALSSSQGKAWRYIYNHFEQGGSVEHPKLGDLVHLLEEMNEKWIVAVHGKNLVITLLTERLRDLSSPFYRYGQVGRL